MLGKAVDSVVDWADFLTLTLFAMRQVPNRSTGFSPDQLVFVKDVVGPLNLFYEGWIDSLMEWTERGGSCH